MTALCRSGRSRAIDSADAPLRGRPHQRGRGAARADTQTVSQATRDVPTLRNRQTSLRSRASRGISPTDCKPAGPLQTLRPSRQAREISCEWAPSSSHAWNDRCDIGSRPSGERCEPRTANAAPGPLLWAQSSDSGSCPAQRHAQNERRTLVCANAPSSQRTLRCVSERLSPPRCTR